VVIGSRLVQEIESAGPDHAIGNLSALLGGIRQAMDEA
jgi:tryptophan synthase alpha subunit